VPPVIVPDRRPLRSLSESAGPAVRCHGLTRRYPDVIAVDGIDLHVNRGSCFGLLGPNGAGKTTTIEILEGLNRPDAGEVEVLGLSWRNDAATLRQRIGVQLQETRLADKLTVTETLRLFRSFYRAGLAVDELLAAVQLQDKATARVGKLSGGQRQRLSLACALVGDPDLLFLDEPTTGLDPQSRRAIWEQVERFITRGRTVLLTTHYMEEAARLCDRIAIMDRGRIIALGSPDELVAGLGADYVVEFGLSAGDGAPVPVDRLDLSSFASLAGVSGVSTTADRIRLTVRHVHAVVPALLRQLQESDLALSSLSTHGATLEDVFVSLTGRGLRDA
jgi:ABC-2 type transport system ATP-binding protein